MALAGDIRTEQFCYRPVALISATASFRRVEIDIGCGRGEFLARLAAQHPETHVIGVELSSDLARRATARVVQRRIPNVTIINGEAETYLDRLPGESVDACHIYFPTPFVRGLGLSKRLITQRFGRSMYRILRTGGIVRLLTDHEAYYRQVLCALHLSQIPWTPVPWRPVSAGQTPEQRVGTHWERRVLAEQARIWSHCILK